MKDYLGLTVWGTLVVVAFAIAWRMGYLVRMSNYTHETREELKKCTWPTWDELKGSTVLVMISIVVLGTFTALVDLVGISFVRLLITPG